MAGSMNLYLHHARVFAITAVRPPSRAVVAAFMLTIPGWSWLISGPRLEHAQTDGSAGALVPPANPP